MDEGKLWYHSNSEVSKSFQQMVVKHESPKNSQQAHDRTVSERVDGQGLNEIKDLF